MSPPGCWACNRTFKSKAVWFENCVNFYCFLVYAIYMQCILTILYEKIYFGKKRYLVDRNQSPQCAPFSIVEAHAGAFFAVKCRRKLFHVLQGHVDSEINRYNGMRGWTVLDYNNLFSSLQHLKYVTEPPNCYIPAAYIRSNFMLPTNTGLQPLPLVFRRAGISYTCVGIYVKVIVLCAWGW